MNDLSLHILDIAENGTRAGASVVRIEISEDTRLGLLSLTITDNGKGMAEEELKRVLDPFYTTKAERDKKIGLGLPLLRETAEQCGGGLTIVSEPGKGTRVHVTMLLNHIDRPPMGDLNETLMVLMVGNPDVRFDVVYDTDGEKEFFSTREDAEEASEGADQNAAG